MGQCRIHGYYSDTFSITGCPDCLRAEESAEEDREALLSTLSEVAASARAPGDYECPHCKYTSLRKNAFRCPLCHGEVGSGFWQQIAAEERRRRQWIEHQEYLYRTDPARDRELAESARRAARKDATDKATYVLTTLLVAPLGCLGGFLVGGVLYLIAGLVVGIVGMMAGVSKDSAAIQLLSDIGGIILPGGGAVIGLLGAVFRGLLEWPAGGILPRISRLNGQLCFRWN